jgi:hypothetical protein
MILMKRFASLAPVLLAVGCQVPGAPTPEQNESRLMQACGETSRLLERMKSAESSFSYDAQGNARIRKDLWNQIPSNMQDTLINAVAYTAVCGSGEPSEQLVTIRASDTSEVLAQQTVTEFDQ